VLSLLLFLQGLHLDRDIAALMLADEGQEGQPPAGASEAGAAAPAAANGGGRKQQQKPVQQQLEDNVEEEEVEEEKETNEPESMVDFLLKAQLSTPAGTAVAAASAAARAALAAPAPVPAGGGSGDPLLRCWHPVGRPETAVAHVAEQLRQMEVGGRGWWQRLASCCPLHGLPCVQRNLR
jgi:hypothetical protein